LCSPHPGISHHPTPLTIRPAVVSNQAGSPQARWITSIHCIHDQCFVGRTCAAARHRSVLDGGHPGRISAHDGRPSRPLRPCSGRPGRSGPAMRGVAPRTELGRTRLYTRRERRRRLAAILVGLLGAVLAAWAAARLVSWLSTGTASWPSVHLRPVLT